jgi:hypothetical protein
VLYMPYLIRFINKCSLGLWFIYSCSFILPDYTFEIKTALTIDGKHLKR